jgi:hypothetical protein
MRKVCIVIVCSPHVKIALKVGGCLPPGCLLVFACLKHARCDASLETSLFLLVENTQIVLIELLIKRLAPDAETSAVEQVICRSGC